MTEKLHADFEQLGKAFKCLERIAAMEPIADRGHIDATIHRFEFTMAVFFRFLRDFLEEKGEMVDDPKDILRMAYKGDLLENEALWIQLLKDYALTPQTYDNALADSIYEHIQQYVPELKETLERIKRRMD